MLFLGDANGLKYCFPTFRANSLVKIFCKLTDRLKSIGGKIIS